MVLIQEVKGYVTVGEAEEKKSEKQPMKILA